MSTLKVQIGAELRQLEQALSRVSRNVDDFGRRVSAVGANLTRRITAPLVGLGTAAGKLAMDFQSSMTRIETLVGLSREQVQGMTQDVLALSREAGRSPKELADALFVVTSAGARGAEAMQILERSAKASASGLGETRDIARAVTAAMQAYGSENLDAAKATDIFTAIVREGNLEADQLSGALGRVIGIASQAGVSFQQVGASIATFTRLGVSAEEAATALRGILQAMIAPGEAARKAMQELGTTSQELQKIIARDGLSAALAHLIDMTDGNVEALSAMIPNIRALSGVLGTAGTQGESYAQIVQNIENSHGLLDDAFNRTTDTLQFKFQRAMANLQKAGIQLGNRLMPIFEKIIDGVTRLTDWFTSLDESSARLILTIGAMAAALPPLILLFGKLAQAIALAMSPIALKIAAFTALALAFEYVRRNFSAFVDFFHRELVRMKNLTILILSETLNEFANFFAALPGMSHLAVAMMRASLLSLTSDLPEIEHEFQSLGEFLGDLGNDVMEIFSRITGIDFKLPGLSEGGELEKYAAQTEIQTAKIGTSYEDMARRAMQSINKMVLVTQEGGQKIPDTLRNLAEVSEQLAVVINTALVDMAESFADSLASMIMSGGGFSNFGAQLLSALGDLAVRMGKIILAAGIGIDSLKKSLMALTGAPAIAAGLALIGVGAIAKAAGSALQAAGAGMGGGSAGSSQFVPSMRSEPSEVVFRIGNNELVGVLQQGSKINNRTGRNVPLQFG